MDQQLDFLTLYRDPSRHAYYGAPGGHEPFYSQQLRAWVVSDPEQAKELLSARQLDTPHYAVEYAALSRRFAIDLEAMGYAFTHVPLTNNGEAHAILRRRMGEHLATRKPATAAWLRDALPVLLAPFLTQGRIESVSASLTPLVRGLMETLTGIADVPDPLTDNPSLLFDRGIGLAKRQRIDREIALLRQVVGDRLGGDAGDDEIGVRVALLVLGRDATLGTLGYSLMDVFEANEGVPMNKIAWPDGPVATGVPHAERVVNTSFSYAGHEFVAGQTVRIILQSLEYTDGEMASHRFFGAGIHACLGRPASMTLWRAVTTILASSPLRVRVLGSVPRSDNYVFACPLTLDLELYE